MTRVLITGNLLRPFYPRSVLFLADIPHINISYNVLPNLSLTVNVEEFQEMTIRCNRLNLYKAPEPGCPVGPEPLVLKNPGPTILSVLEPGSQLEDDDDDDNEVEEETVRELSASDIYGLVWIVVAAVLLVLIVLSVVCCCCARIRNNKEDESGEKEVNQYHQVEEEDNYNQLEMGLMTIKEDEARLI